VIELTHPLTLILIGNSFVTLVLVFNQNDSPKDAISSSQNIGSSPNPFEKATWICFISQLILLLIKTKLTDF
jgi:hypothetical protein